MKYPIIMVDERSISHYDFSLCFLTHHKPKERAGSKMSYYDRALELKDELIENRRYLHSHGGNGPDGVGEEAAGIRNRT